ncbi:uncharacterized protein TrAtP1_006127 [Trichoderma atroviride]|uniref:uncharacterized protein n=1 Tax=Hypocrea atroviridis TaxID=63577 RepID=UPI0033198A8A|nr:hypothetical protein TrAtP1_006127 [Trichoderma atroviride]
MPNRVHGQEQIRAGRRHNTRVMETDDYRRQGAGTSSRAESVGSPRWIWQYVRSNGKRITAAGLQHPRHAGGAFGEGAALIGRRSSGREALQRSRH